MTWVSPPTFVDEEYLYAADLNALVGDLIYLKELAEAAPSGMTPFVTGSDQVAIVNGGVWIAAASVTFAAGADLNHRISLSIGGHATQKSLGGGVTTQLCVGGAARVANQSRITVTNDGQGTVNSMIIAAVRVGD